MDYSPAQVDLINQIYLRNLVQNLTDDMQFLTGQEETEAILAEVKEKILTLDLKLTIPTYIPTYAGEVEGTREIDLTPNLLAKLHLTFYQFYALDTQFTPEQVKEASDTVITDLTNLGGYQTENPPENQREQ